MGKLPILSEAKQRQRCVPIDFKFNIWYDTTNI